MLKAKIIGTPKTTLKLFLILLITHCSLLITNCFAQIITWERTYGHTDPYYEYANSIIQTPDEGYLVAGYDVSYQKALVIRLNKYGDTLWYKAQPYGAPCINIMSTYDGSYIAFMATNYLIKFDINGNIIWYGGPYNSDALMVGIVQLNDSGFIMWGAKFFGNIVKPHIIRINSNGYFLWERTYTNFYDAIFTGMCNQPANELVFAGGYGDSSVSSRLFIMKTDLTGNQIFFYGYDTLFWHYPIFIHKTLSNNFVIGGTNFLVNINQSGEINWYKRYLNYLNYEYLSLTNTNDGGFAITGWFDSVGSSYERLFILKTDSSGNEQWRRIKSTNDHYKGKSIKQTSDSGFVIAGYKNNDVYVLKTDSEGFNLIGITPISNIIPITSKLYQNFPNPFNPITKIKFDIAFVKNHSVNLNVKLTIFNILGQEIEVLINERLSEGSYEIDFNADNLPSGIYFYKLETEDYMQSKKMIVLK